MVNDNRWTYPGLSWEEEQKTRAWEELPVATKEARIEEARLNRVHWGHCQRCGFKIEATGKEWPGHCPRCGYGNTKEEADRMWQEYLKKKHP